MFRSSFICISAATATVAFALSTPALAIKCQNGYQMVQGNLISTPYCQDQYLAQVARQYGVNAPAAELRNNPNYKRNVCRLVGRDIRIQETCSHVTPEGRRGY